MLPHVGTNSQTTISGAGAGIDESESTLPALAEGLERYCASAYSSEQFRWATAEELRDEALDLAIIPRCSNRELSHARCPLVAPKKTAPIRWVPALSLLDGRIVHLPVVMVYLFAGLKTPEERICLPITTGCAAHTSYERALTAAILEVIERDAISIVWLQKLGLPRIEIDSLPSNLAAYWERYLRSSKELEYVFLDATTDVGIPIVYGLQISHSNRHLTTLVSCSSAFNPADAIIKVMRDMAALRIAFRVARPAPHHYEDFTGVFHGASYLARAEQAGAFNFLMQSSTKRLLSQMPSLERGSDDRDSLRIVLEILRRRQLNAYAVDLSTDEALRCGFRVVRVVIPGLQPLSFHYRARYLGHPRLYEAPEQMGYPVLREEEVNPWPQAFC